MAHPSPGPPPLFVVAAVGQTPEETAALLELLAGESLHFHLPAAQASPGAIDWHGGRVKVRYAGASRRRAFLQCTAGLDPASLAALAAAATTAAATSGRVVTPGGCHVDHTGSHQLNVF
jgi:hypothetical protein